ncbi:protein draper-like [Prorops nasuta]|uniref:protein draper-like n=1 Tax=Prorops nasuta TaxID=863751 RepID=UPI0034CD43BC
MSYGEECEETIQCSSYLGSGGICKDNNCACAPGYHYLHGRCNLSAGLFQTCRTNDECYVNTNLEAMVCNQQTCSCSKGFYQREYRMCRREGKKIGDECEINNDCRFPNASCNSGLCAIKSEKYLADLKINSFIINEKEFNIPLENACSTNKDCEARNAICGLFGKCICQRAHFFLTEGGKCIPELGEQCKKDDEALIEKSECRNDVWRCKKNTVALKNNRVCRKIITNINYNCQFDEQCYIFGPDAVCNKKCVCNENSHFVQNELFCWRNRDFGDKCDDDNDCYLKGYEGPLACRDKKCSCPKGFFLNVKGTACVNIKELGMDCAADSECAPINATCTNGKCSCKENFVSVSSQSCLPISAYGKQCNYDVQCSTAVPNAICLSSKKSETKIANNVAMIDSKLCSCAENHHYRFQACHEKKVIGEACTRLGDCYVQFDIEDAVRCKNEICTCTWGYKKINSTACAKDGAAILTPMMGLTMLVFIATVKYFT